MVILFKPAFLNEQRRSLLYIKKLKFNLITHVLCEIMRAEVFILTIGDLHQTDCKSESNMWR